MNAQLLRALARTRIDAIERQANAHRSTAAGAPTQHLLKHVKIRGRIVPRRLTRSASRLA